MLFFIIIFIFRCLWFLFCLPFLFCLWFLFYIFLAWSFISIFCCFLMILSPRQASQTSFGDDLYKISSRYSNSTRGQKFWNIPTCLIAGISGGCTASFRYVSIISILSVRASFKLAKSLESRCVRKNLVCIPFCSFWSRHIRCYLCSNIIFPSSVFSHLKM